MQKLWTKMRDVCSHGLEYEDWGFWNVMPWSLVQTYQYFRGYPITFFRVEDKSSRENGATSREMGTRTGPVRQPKTHTIALRKTVYKHLIQKRINTSGFIRVQYNRTETELTLVTIHYFSPFGLTTKTPQLRIIRLPTWAHVSQNEMLHDESKIVQ
jgi:hypothetical protein